MGEQANPTDSISYTIPRMVSPVGGYVANSLHDYFGLPTAGQLGTGNTISHNSLPLRAYNIIWNAWFRDENLQNSVQDDSQTDGPDTYSNYVLLRRGKRHDYFTSCLPWPQKGALAVTVPLSGTAPVQGDGFALGITDGTSFYGLAQNVAGSALVANSNAYNAALPGSYTSGGQPAGSAFLGLVAGPTSNLVANLSAATGTTINALRTSFAIQKLLERDARGGTRYTEIVRSHFGVVSDDARLQRPEYLGGGVTPVNIAPIAQTSATGLTGGSTVTGSLAAMGTALAHKHGFTKSFTEHGIILGMVAVRADLTYQQGLHRYWSRSARYDFYFPAFATLGENTVLNQEIYCTGNGASGDTLVFGYQERWAEYRYKPSMITGLFRSTYATPLDAWHLSQKFTSLPTLNTTFIQDTPPLSRNIAIGAAANGQQFIFDAFFDLTCARPMPMYSVPGMIDRF